MVVGRIDVDMRHGRGARRHTGGGRHGLLEQVQEASGLGDVPQLLWHPGSRNRPPQRLDIAREQEEHAQAGAGEPAEPRKIYDDAAAWLNARQDSLARFRGQSTVQWADQLDDRGRPALADVYLQRHAPLPELLALELLPRLFQSLVLRLRHLWIV
jgi:hypothetical protein